MFTQDVVGSCSLHACLTLNSIGISCFLCGTNWKSVSEREFLKSLCGNLHEHMETDMGFTTVLEDLFLGGNPPL
ncbi:hypothetical protein Q8A67_012006 [Cirrhinus molitorella]|uniref:Uncharacterized protein n=1 Tax=Cirrhinus molitorella TaxID=172907 RepID=A0AA88PPA1_9TELE|nr:hypothetical protein Q8A67_012006 [Cirrhinus molitorella]